MWNSTVRAASSLPNAGNWLLLALFALALASAGLSIRLFIVPCDKKTSYETTNTTTIINVTSYFNQTVLENVTVTETVLQLENVTTRENVTREISYNVQQCMNQIVAARLGPPGSLVDLRVGHDGGDDDAQRDVPAARGRHRCPGRVTLCLG